MRALNNNTTDNFWFESGTSASLIEHLKHFPDFNPLDFDGVELSLEEFKVRSNHILRGSKHCALACSGS